MAKRGDRIPIMQRVLAKVEIDPGSGCWVWQGGKNSSVGAPRKDAYGLMGIYLVDGGRPTMMYVHRVVYEHYNGPIPPGYHVDHVKAAGCTSTLCCNPDHLEAVTPRTNVLRSDGVAAVNAAKDCCDRGHPLSGDNLYVHPKGQRACRTCQRASFAKYDAKRGWRRPSRAAS